MKGNAHKDTHIRTRIISIVFLCVGLVFIIKLFSMQVVHGARFRQSAEDKYIVTTGDNLERGSIYFKKKDGELVSAATVRTGFKVVINPKRVQSPAALYEQLLPILPQLEKGKFIEQASRKNDESEEVANKIDRATADQIIALQNPAVSVVRENWRFYPAEQLASHVVGFMGYDGDQFLGRYGLERSQESVLAKHNQGLYVNFFAQVFSDVSSLLSTDDRSGDVVTTIEPSVQVFMEDRLQDLQERWNPESGGAIIMNPQTGAIYAMGAYPNFDPNNYGQYPVATFKNPLTENVYEMGSTIKPLIVAAGLDTGVITAQTSYFDSGEVVVGDRTIRNFDRKGRGQVTMQDVLNQSLNTGMVLISQKMTKAQMRDYITAYGLTQKSGIDLPNEANNLMQNLKSNRDVEFANISFGQGIAMTPISTIRALASLGNGGKLVTPHVIDRIDYPSGLQKKMEYPIAESSVITPETSEEISRMLTTVVDTTLMNGREKMERYTLAAKTGTAQIPNPYGGGYYADRNIHTFFGYFPAYDPQFIVFMYVVHPKGARFASETLAPPFFDTAKFLLNYYNIPPDR